MATGSKTYWLVTRVTPAACRSVRLRRAGVRPADAYGYRFRMPEHAAGAVSDPVVWDYEPGNDRDHAVTVERGAWTGNALPYLFRSYNPETTRYEWHTAWNLACRWRCGYDGTLAEPWPASPAWRVTDFFPTLIVEIETRRNGDGSWDVIPHVYTHDRTEEIIPHLSIPAISSWTKQTVRPDQDTAALDAAFNAAHATGADTLHLTEAQIGVERDEQGNVTHTPGAIRLTFRKTMTTAGAHLSPLYDSVGSILTDSTGDTLYTLEGCIYLTDSDDSVLTDLTGSKLYNEDGEDVTGVAAETMIIEGTCYINA